MLRKQTCFYRGVKSKEGKRKADLPFVATGRAELKFPDEEEEKEGVSDERTDGRTKARALRRATQSLGSDAHAGEMETGERNYSHFNSLKLNPMGLLHGVLSGIVQET